MRTPSHPGPIPSPAPILRVSVWPCPRFPLWLGPCRPSGSVPKQPRAGSEARSWQVRVWIHISISLVPALPLLSHPAMTVTRLCTHTSSTLHTHHTHTSHNTHTYTTHACPLHHIHTTRTSHMHTSHTTENHTPCTQAHIEYHTHLYNTCMSPA